jgi:hypothetical protein
MTHTVYGWYGTDNDMAPERLPDLEPFPGKRGCSSSRRSSSEAGGGSEVAEAIAGKPYKVFLRLKEGGFDEMDFFAILEI